MRVIFFVLKNSKRHNSAKLGLMIWPGACFKNICSKDNLTMFPSAILSRSTLMTESFSQTIGFCLLSNL